MLTERRDLRGGHPCWTDILWSEPDPLPTARVDVAIIGAGIMGAMLAERLSVDGMRVAVVDRRPAAHGSTAASTALTMWASDVPLSHLAKEIGEDEAARRWRRVRAAVSGLADKIDSDGIDCGRAERPELYLAGTLLDEAALAAEGDLRARYGLPSEFLAAAAVAGRFDIFPRAALLSQGSFEVDPVRLTLGLLERARAAGCSVTWPADVVALETLDDGIALALDGGARLTADRAIIAGGYERASLFLPADFTLSSSYAVATPPGTAPLWRDNAMIWEAADGYIYARATADGRIIAGGEDEEFVDPIKRDALIGAKRGVLQAKLAALANVHEVAVDCAWAATFGSSPDGLPAIGRAANHDRLWLASGFGGNGLTFAALSAELLSAEFGGSPDADAACFDPYRFG